MKLRNSIRFTLAALTAGSLLWCGNESKAAELNPVDPTGTWKIATINPETKSKVSEAPMKLKLEGGKLTGTITHQSTINGKTRVLERVLKETKLQGDDISFTVSIPPVTGTGPEATKTYRGKITGDTMKGKVETEWNGTTFRRDWEAKRVKE